MMVVLMGVLAILSAAAAAGLRLGLPLLIIAILHADLWADLPVLSLVPPRVLLAILISWSLFELLGSKSLLGQRTLQVIALVFSPMVGALMSLTVARIINLEVQPLWIIGLLGGLVALVLKLVQVGWFFRLRGLPLWVTVVEDILCVGLVFLSLRSPQNGGLIALLLLWLAIRSSTVWRDWYLNRRSN